MEGEDEAAIAKTLSVNKDKEAQMQAQSSLYEAYSELHGLAQELGTPFQAPAVLVVGHQTDGKSALVEALMGFQFNHVGGGTKTRRPITLHMKYDPDCHLPVCHLVSDDDPTIAHHKTLAEIQACFFSMLVCLFVPVLGISVPCLFKSLMYGSSCSEV